MLTPMVLRFSFNHSGIVLNAPTTMGITYVLTPHICRISLAKSRYFSTFSSSFSLTLPLSGIATSIIWQLFSFLSMINRSGLLASISWSAPILNLFSYLKFIYLFIIIIIIIIIVIVVIIIIIIIIIIVIVVMYTLSVFNWLLVLGTGHVFQH